MSVINLKSFKDSLPPDEFNQVLTFFKDTTAGDKLFIGQVRTDAATDPVQAYMLTGADPATGTWTPIGYIHAIRNDEDDSFDGCLTSTITAGPVLKFDNGESMITVHDGFGNFNIRSGVDETHTVTVNDGGSFLTMAHTGQIKLAVTNTTQGNPFSDDQALQINGSGVTVNGNAVCLASTQKVMVQGFTSALVSGWNTVSFPTAYTTVHAVQVTAQGTTTTHRAQNHTATTVDVYVSANTTAYITAIGVV